MKQSYIKAGIGAGSKALIMIGIIIGTPFLIYGLVNGEWVVAFLGLLNFGFSFKVMHAYKSTAKFVGSVEDQVRHEILSDQRFANSPLVIEENHKRSHIKTILKYGPLIVILGLFLMWASIPTFKTVLKYFPAKLVRPNGTF